MTGTVYFVRSADHVKIGYTTDLIGRISQLQTGCPHKLELIAAVPGAESLEKIFHKVLKDKRFRGEWFCLDDDLYRRLRLMLKMIRDGKVRRIISEYDVRRVLGFRVKREHSAQATRRMNRAEYFQRVAHRNSGKL
jgi:hypothetical protein